MLQPQTPSERKNNRAQFVSSELLFIAPRSLYTVISADPGCQSVWQPISRHRGGQRVRPESRGHVRACKGSDFTRTLSLQVFSSQPEKLWFINKEKKNPWPYVYIFVCVNYSYLAHVVASVRCRGFANKLNTPTAGNFLWRILKNFSQSRSAFCTVLL